MRTVVLTTYGSLGDLHPYIAIALGLQARGHRVIVATSACYQQRIEALGLRFHAIRPDSDWALDPAMMQRFMDSRWGTVRVGRELVLPSLRQSYDDILAAAQDADLLVSHPLTAYATRLVAEKTGIPWASTMITPLGFFSAHDPPIIPVVPGASEALRWLGPTIAAPSLWMAKRACRFLARPWYRLTAELGLPATNDANPLIDSHSPRMVLALFSPHFAIRQPDWPQQAITTGFPFYDRDAELSVELQRFLDAGPPPLVFTLAASASTVAGEFFTRSADAARLLGCRAVLVTGGQRLGSLPEGVIAVDYAPFSKLFPHAAAIIHAGGIGTTGLALHAGRPMLVVPFAHDQIDNAARLRRLGVARTIGRTRYHVNRVAKALRQVLDESAYCQRTLMIAARMEPEDGVRASCEALESVFAA